MENGGNHYIKFKSISGNVFSISIDKKEKLDYPYLTKVYKKRYTYKLYYPKEHIKNIDRPRLNFSNYMIKGTSYDIVKDEELFSVFECKKCKDIFIFFNGRYIEFLTEQKETYFVKNRKIL